MYVLLHPFPRPKILAELLRPLSSAFTELWLDGEKAATVEWRDEADKAMPAGLDVDAEMVKDNGRGIVLNHPVEPLYGDIYMPRECCMVPCRVQGGDGPPHGRVHRGLGGRVPRCRRSRLVMEWVGFWAAPGDGSGGAR